jgi:tetratricopeptide (TPR) repeat protein
MAFLYRHTLNHNCLALIVACIVQMVGSNQRAYAESIETCRRLFKTGQYTQCLESLRKAVLDLEDDKQCRILKIETLMALGQYEQAAREADLALLRYPVSIELLKLGHTAYQQCGRGQRSLDMLSKIYRLGGLVAFDLWEPPDMVALGEALLLFGGEPRIVLEQFFNRAMNNDPNCRQAYLAAGKLALDKQDYELAAGQYRKALERFGDDPDMHYGLARAFYDSDRNAMVKSLDAALHVNPNHVPSLLLLAEHQIDCEDYTAAAKSLDRAVDVNPSCSQAYAYSCVLAYLANDSEAVKQNRASALKLWSDNPEVDFLIGSKLSAKYLFAEGAAYQRQALKFDPEYLPAKIQLAVDLLRLGDEQQGWGLAEEVHKQDAYNVEAYNLISLHDNLSKFRTLRDDKFIVRMDELEAAVYGDEVLKLLQQASSELCKKYDLQLAQPVIVELFANQQDFAVRTFGMPAVDGFLGVCFGNVITANSPKAQKPSNWKSMLWHEFCHVVTLNLTHNKMPRWLSEGISVYEEQQHNPTWGQNMNPQYRTMILQGQLTPISKLSAAFLNPSTPSRLQFAYYESSLVVEFLVERFGLHTIKAILAELANGQDINTAIAKHAEPLNIVNKEFETFVRKRADDLAPAVDWEQPQGQIDFANDEALADWLGKHPNNFWALTQYAKNLIAVRKWDQAKEPLNKLIELYPQYTSDDNAYRLLAEVHRNLDETEKERDVLNALADKSCDASYAYGRLMEIAVEKKNWQEVIRMGEKYIAVYPLFSTLYWQLGRANEELGRDEQAVQSFRRLLALGTSNPADVNYRLGRLLQHKEPVAAKRYVLTALAEAPRFREAHRLLLKMNEPPTNTSGDTDEGMP